MPLPTPQPPQPSHAPATPGETGGFSAISGTGMSSLGSGLAAAGRQTFAADELAIVLSHYDLGPLEAVTEFPRGSRKAPKLLIRAAKQTYLLKRRARGKDDPYKVAFSHGLQMHLADRQFPLPHLIGTRKDNNSMLKWNDSTYELFEYIKGGVYDASLEATAESGRILALFHKLLLDYHPKYPPPRGSYHASRSVANSINAIPTTLLNTEPTLDRGVIGKLTQSLHESYLAAAKRVNDAGLPDWPRTIVHSDWHPGNMLFRGQRVVAVIDYDAARIQQRVVDIANGALQFAILGGTDDAATWPEYLDESRFKRFVRTYDAVPDAVLSRAELRTLPHLMVEAIIAESAIPIAATGYFGRMPGSGFLGMVQRKVRWLQENADKLVRSVED